MPCSSPAHMHSTTHTHNVHACTLQTHCIHHANTGGDHGCEGQQLLRLLLWQHPPHASQKQVSCGKAFVSEDVRLCETALSMVYEVV